MKDKKITMWWNLPIEEVEELARENKLNTTWSCRALLEEICCNI